MAILVYQLTCTVSGKSYIGITSRSLDTRWLEHCARARSGSREASRLYNAMRKYGLDAWTRTIIDAVDTDDEGRAAEKTYILKLDTFAKGYNANEGGHGHLIVSESTRRKIGEAKLGQMHSAKTRAQMSAAKKGRKECAGNFGEHTQKGKANPRCKSYLVRFPDGSERVITGLRAFCREHDLRDSVLRKGSLTHGYKLICNLGSNGIVADNNSLNIGVA